MSEIIYSPKNNWVQSTDNKEGTTRNTVKFLKLDNTPTCLDTEILQILLKAAANKVVEIIPEEELKRIADRVIAEELITARGVLIRKHGILRPESHFLRKQRVKYYTRWIIRGYKD